MTQINKNRFSILFLLVGACTFSMAQTTINRHWNMEDDLQNEADPLYQRNHTLRVALWSHSVQFAGIAYFVYDSSPRIERFNMATELWLPTIELAEAATAFAVDSDGLFIGFTRRASQFQLNGTSETHLRNTPQDITDIFTMGDFVYLKTGTTIWSLEKGTGTLIDSNSYFYRMGGISVATSINKAFARSTNVSPTDVLYLELNPDGSLGTQDDSPYHGDYPSASKTWVFANDALVVDNAGIIYHTGNLTYSNSLGGGFDCLDFYNTLPIVLRDQTFTSYSSTFLETGNHTVVYQPEVFYIQGETIFAFYDVGGLTVEQVPIASLTPAEPGEVIDPNGLAYVPDDIIVGDDGIAYILSRGFLSIFRWSIAQEVYLETIPLSFAPDFMAYSGPNNALYLSYPGGPIHRIGLDADFDETPFVNSPQTPLGLATAGPYLFVCDATGAWVSHFTYHPDGTLLSQEEWNYFSREYIWSAANNKMYFFRDATSPNDLIWEDIDANGIIGQQMDSPFHGTYSFQHPIRMTHDESMVLIGSGIFFDAQTLDFSDALPNDVDGAASPGGLLVTSREAGINTEIQLWNPNLALGESFFLSGEHQFLLEASDTLVVVTLIDGIPQFAKFKVCAEGAGGMALVPEWPVVSVLSLVNAFNECQL